MKNKNKWISGGGVGAILGLILVRWLLEFIRNNNLPDGYRISIYAIAAIIALIGAVKLGKKNKKIRSSILLCIFIISFLCLYFLLNIIKSTYPQYVHIYKIPIVIGMIISFVLSILFLFSVNNEK